MAHTAQVFSVTLYYLLHSKDTIPLWENSILSYALKKILTLPGLVFKAKMNVFAEETCGRF